VRRCRQRPNTIPWMRLSGQSCLKKNRVFGHCTWLWKINSEV
jgi:hypothetical protein